jgi:intein-encoded DNA endonuclease-like protein
VPVYKKVNKDFFKKWSPDMAYMLGFFFADGSLDINPRGSHYFSFQIKDKDLLGKLKKTLSSEHKISKRIHKKDKSVCYRLQIGSKEMFSDLAKLGVKEIKSKTMNLPEVPKKYMGHFVRGYFDGDGNVWSGWVHKDRPKMTYTIQVAFTSASEKFLSDLRKELFQKELGKGSLISRENYWRLQYSVNDTIILYHLMYNDCESLKLDRKKKVFEDYFRKMRL